MLLIVVMQDRGLARPVIDHDLALMWMIWVFVFVLFLSILLSLLPVTIRGESSQGRNAHHF